MSDQHVHSFSHGINPDSQCVCGLTRAQVYLARHFKTPEPTPPNTHHCHAFECGDYVEPKMLMCPKHWKMVPKPLQAEVWRTYRRGQEKDKNPSEAYMVAQRKAVTAVAYKEGKEFFPKMPNFLGNE